MEARWARAGITVGRNARRIVQPCVRLAVVAALLLVPWAASTQERPLPDLAPFLAEVRARLEPDEARQSEYVYTETRRELKLDGTGRTTRETVSVYESYPALPGEPRWQRRIVEDGRPVPHADLDRQDRKRQEHVEAWLRGQGGSEKARAAAARERERRRREDAAALDDAFGVYDIRMLGREAVDGHDTIVFSLTPRRNARPRTREGKLLTHFVAKAWISEADHELVRLEGEAIDTVSFGLGLLARVHKGSRAAFQRRKVNGETWLPASAEYTASARVMLLRRLRVGGTSTFSDYRKFSVATDTALKPPP
jgi:hypothetical protein